MLLCWIGDHKNGGKVVVLSHKALHNIRRGRRGNGVSAPQSGKHNGDNRRWRVQWEIFCVHESAVDLFARGVVMATGCYDVVVGG